MTSENNNDNLDWLDEKKEFSAAVCLVCFGLIALAGLVVGICHIIYKFG